MTGNLYGFQQDWLSVIALILTIAVVLFGAAQAALLLLDERPRRFYLPRLLYGAVASGFYLYSAVVAEIKAAVLTQLLRSGSPFATIVFGTVICLVAGVFVGSVVQIWKGLSFRSFFYCPISSHPNI